MEVFYSEGCILLFVRSAAAAPNIPGAQLPFFLQDLSAQLSFLAVLQELSLPWNSHQQGVPLVPHSELILSVAAAR